MIVVLTCKGRVRLSLYLCLLLLVAHCCCVEPVWDILGNDTHKSPVQSWSAEDSRGRKRNQNYRQSASASKLFQAKVNRYCKVISQELSDRSQEKVSEKPAVKEMFSVWWQNYWEPSWSCYLEERVQTTRGDGGKWVCDVILLPPKTCLVYSFGSHGDFSFELAMQKKKGCEIHVFDPFKLESGPDLPGKRNQDLPNIHIHKWGLAPYNYETLPLKKYKDTVAVMKNLTTIMTELGHVGRVIDILKVDVDGCEYGIFDNQTVWDEWKGNGVHFEQLLLEVHFQVISKDTFAFRDLQREKLPFKSGYEVDKLLSTITKNQYAIFHKEVNLMGVPPNDACEYAFVKLNGTNCR